MALDVFDLQPAIELKPSPVQVLGDGPELDDQITG
jgi:hypothetical protein